MKTLRLIAFFLLALGGTAHAAQYNPVLPTSSPYPGLTMLGNINSAFQGFLSNNSGASPPSYEVEGTIYANSSYGYLEFYTGSNWADLGTFSSTAFAPLVNGAPLVCPTSTGSSNAYVVTDAPAIGALVTGTPYCFISNFGNTTTATVNFDTLGAKTIKKNGGTALASGDIPSGAVVQLVYDGTYMQLTSQIGNASGAGTVTSIATNNGVTGGTITGSGTIGLATISNDQVLANISGSTGAPGGTGAPVVTSLGITATGASAAGFIGMHSASAGALSLSTSAVGDAVVISSTGGVTANESLSVTSTFSAASASISGTTTTDNLTVTGTCTGCGGGFLSQNNVTSSRGCNAVYHNTTGKTMFVSAVITVNNDSGINAVSDNSSSPSLLVAAEQNGFGSSANMGLSFMVLNGNYYEVSGSGCGSTASWIEWE